MSAVASSLCGPYDLQAELVSPYRWIFVFLQPLAEAVELVCDRSVCLGDVIFERRVPAKINQGCDDQNFNQ
jgi:hypothetical protein